MKIVSKLESLNGIRGFAILLVLLSHSSASGMVLHDELVFTGAGRYGVFLFFVLSAFLLTRQFLIADEDERFSPTFLKKYLWRRFLRIYPLYTISLVVYYVLFSKGYQIVPVSGEMIIKSLFLLDAEGIFWTIPVEFQYYFILPAVAFLLSLTLRPLLIVIAAALFCGVWSYLIPPEYTVHLLPFIPIFVIGSVSAKLYCSIPVPVRDSISPIFGHKIINVSAIVILSVYVIITPHFYNILFQAKIGRVHFHDHFVPLAVLSGAFILTTLCSSGVVRFIMESRFFVFWGKVSFSAYLGHKIVLAFVNEITILSPSLKCMLFFVFTALFSYLSYRFFERPLAGFRLSRARVV